MLKHLTLQTRRVALLSASLALALASVVPAIMPSFALAAPSVTERELQSSSAVPGGTSVTLTWILDTPNNGATNVDHIEIEFCDSPLSSCANVDGDTADPSGGGSTDNIPVLPALPTATLSGPWASTGNSASRVDGRQAATAGSGNQITIDKTTVDDNSNKDELQIQIAGFTNDDVANRSYYTRMRMYSDAGTTLVYEGVFAQSTSQTLTVNARVQERLDFCVGSTAIDDATTSVAADCSAVTGSAVDIGNIESGQNNVSPVDATNGGDDENGVAMVRTNAVNGVVVDYRALLNTSSGALKVAGATCGAVPSVTGTDQCFNTSATQSTLVAGTEEFGMTIAGINCGSVTAYTCDFLSAGGGGVAGTDYNLQRDTEFDGAGAGVYVTDANQVAGTTNGSYAWDASGSADRIASSAASTVKVIDDEAMILKFAATAGITTPTGSYSVQADFIATATF